jgi:hypothetical protein
MWRSIGTDTTPGGWLTDRLSAPVMSGEVEPGEVAEQTWAVFASA